jgi:two-component system LytT family sensor kinase
MASSLRRFLVQHNNSNKPMAPVFKIKKPSKLLVHCIVWAIIFMLPYVFNTWDEKDEASYVDPYRSINTVTNFLWMGLFYLNASVFIPRLFYKKRYMQYALLLLCSFCVVMLLHGALFRPFVLGHTFNFKSSSVHNIIPFLFTIFVSTTYQTISDRIKAETLLAAKQQENLKTELSFLRSQISPHFLFNVMNNIAAMVRLKSDELEPTIHKLSSLMQYMLYETDEDKVLLQSEIEYLQSYIDLQRQRFSEKLKLHVSLDVKENWHTIEPMLLIPFVENAFKHGTGLIQNPEIEIELMAEHDKLYFIVKNKFIQTETVKDKTSGIGLVNVKRRLELLYGNRQQLTINKTNDWFTASLQLTFKS